MSQHPSLRSSDKDKQHRSVLKRYERINILKDKEKWKDKDSVFGLPKVKVVKFKIKKEKAAAAETAEAVEAAPGAVPTTTPAAGAAKGATPAKGAAPAKGAKEATKPQGGGEPKKETK
jgi:small basic protein (TIGR04137 family)